MKAEGGGLFGSEKSRVASSLGSDTLVLVSRSVEGVVSKCHSSP